LQVSRVNVQIENYEELLLNDISSYEKAVIAFLWIAVGHQVAASAAYISASLGGTWKFWQEEKSLATFASGLSAAASAASTTSSIFQIMASNERRRQEWQYQLKLAQVDFKIADMGVALAEDRMAIVDKEKEISQLQQQHANDTLNFLEHKRFTGSKLYNWMRTELSKIYRNQLYIALGMARMAQQALAFERQQTITTIKHNYWEGERKGLLGTEKLLQDINSLEELRIQTDIRKKELTKTLSFASYAPAEFQRFKESGIMEFTPQMAWFDRYFPGHYMRLIKRISVSVVALLPATEQIRATLSDNGCSHVMVGAPWQDYKVIYREPESIALSFALGATGLFEANLHDPMLLPFEGKGVDTSWTLEMPKGANRFNFDTLFDVLLRIEYTAMEDRSYRDIVLRNMGMDDQGFVPVQSIHYIGMHNQFPDEWYKFQNTPGPDRILEFEVKESIFPPNENAHRITLLNLAAVQDVENKQTVNAAVEFDDTTVSAELEDGFIQDEFIKRKFNGKSPFGAWKIKVSDDTQAESLKDLIWVVNYRGKVRY